MPVHKSLFRSQLIRNRITDHSQYMILYTLMIFKVKNHLSTEMVDPNKRSNKEIFK